MILEHPQASVEPLVSRAKCARDLLMTPDRRGRGGARHSHPPLPRASERQGDFDQLHRLDRPLVARPRHRAKLDGQCQVGQIRRDAGEGHGRHLRAGLVTKDLALLVGDTPLCSPRKASLNQQLLTRARLSNGGSSPCWRMAAVPLTRV
jgi:hypothetical protein